MGKGTELRCILEVKLEVCSNAFDMGGERKRSVKDDSTFFSRSHRQIMVPLSVTRKTEKEQVAGRARFQTCQLRCLGDVQMDVSSRRLDK